MPKKILSVDDSKTVRLIVRKALKTFDVVVREAQNGEEGLVVARAEKPDLILLDVTMPVLDGVEMLARLKADPVLQKIPVVMLTAEAGREIVLKIAKIGARDYLVKPFTEQTLIEKLKRIIPLDSVKNVQQEPKLVVLVEDKLAVVQRVLEAVRDPAWTWKHVASPAEALGLAEQHRIAAVVISLSLPDEGALGLLRDYRLRPNLAGIPFIGLALKTASAEKAQAMQAGFAATSDKPIDRRDLETKLQEAMKHEGTGPAIVVRDERLIVAVTESMTPSQLEAALVQLTAKAPEAVDSGLSLAVFDLTGVKRFSPEIVTFLAAGIKQCEELGMRCVLLGDAALAAASRTFDEAANWQFQESLEPAGA